MQLHVTVESSDEDAAPVSFLLGATAHTVQEVADRWFGADSTFFKVVADDGNVYILRHHSAGDNWTLESFRSSHIT
jgi:hypothetical protein